MSGTVGSWGAPGEKSAKKAKECAKLLKLYRPCNQVQKSTAKHSAQTFFKISFIPKETSKERTKKGEKHAYTASHFYLEKPNTPIMTTQNVVRHSISCIELPSMI